MSSVMIHFNVKCKVNIKIMSNIVLEIEKFNQNKSFWSETKWKYTEFNEKRFNEINNVFE